jgi:hypothetical protein
MIDNSVEQVLSGLDIQLQSQAAQNLNQALDDFSTQQAVLTGATPSQLKAAIAAANQSTSIKALASKNQIIGPGVTTNPDPNFNAAAVAGDFAGSTGGGGVGALDTGAASGSWTSIHYGDDWIPHQPKFKFLFKVKFEGQSTDSFYYYVKSADKPKIRFEHQEVNYYNFRTKVLTRASFDPLSLTFWDEIGNSLNAFFVEYLDRQSGQGSGTADINLGFGKASSTFPYDQGAAKPGYSFLKRITLQQIFANGVASNKYHFWNPRIESFDFDPLDLEDNGGSMVTMMFNYDAISMETTGGSPIHTWGETDILNGGSDGGAGGASSAIGAVGGTDGVDFTPTSVHSGRGGGVFGSPSPCFDFTTNSGTYSPFNTATNTLNSISDLIPGANIQIPGSIKPFISSAETTISRSVQDTINNVAASYFNPNLNVEE